MRVCMGQCGFAWASVGLHGLVWVCMDWCGFAWAGVGLHGLVWVACMG